MGGGGGEGGDWLLSAFKACPYYILNLNNFETLSTLNLN